MGEAIGISFISLHKPLHLSTHPSPAIRMQLKKRNMKRQAGGGPIIYFSLTISSFGVSSTRAPFTLDYKTNERKYKGKKKENIW